MPKFSRWMPPLQPPPFGIGDWIAVVVIVALLAGFLGFVGWAVFLSPVCFGGAVLLFLSPWMLAARSSSRHDRRIANERTGEDIGTFARAFDRRTEPFDALVVRATWDALQEYVTYPLRPTDRIFEDLCIDADDVFFGLLPDVAKRTGHSLANPQANPYFAKFGSSHEVTVGDLVKFVSWQPKIDTDPTPLE